MKTAKPQNQGRTYLKTCLKKKMCRVLIQTSSPINTYVHVEFFKIQTDILLWTAKAQPE